MVVADPCICQPAHLCTNRGGKASREQTKQKKRQQGYVFKGSHAGGEVRVEELGYRGACTEPSITHHTLAKPHPNDRTSRFLSVCTYGMSAQQNAHRRDAFTLMLSHLVFFIAVACIYFFVALSLRLLICWSTCAPTTGSFHFLFNVPSTEERHLDALPFHF